MHFCNTIASQTHMCVYGSRRSRGRERVKYFQIADSSSNWSKNIPKLPQWDGDAAPLCALDALRPLATHAPLAGTLRHYTSHNHAYTRRGISTVGEIPKEKEKYVKRKVLE